MPENARILDIGPGSGINLPILRDRGRVAVLDLDPSSLQNCREHGASELLYADAVAPPLRDASVDLICALDVLEHLPEDARALAAWRALLREDGRMLLSVPALPILWGRQDVLSHHQRRYRKRQLADLVRTAGFEIERLTYFNTLLFPPILAVRVAMRPFLSRTVENGSSDLATPVLGLGNVLYHAFAAESGWLVKRDLPIGVSLLCLARPR